MARTTALITGCSDGSIGSTIVKVNLKRGFHVFATARSIKKLSTLAGFSNVTLLAMDVTSDENISETQDNAVGNNNSGIYYFYHHGNHPFMTTWCLPWCISTVSILRT
jgi:short-subunit dehydrogenase